MPQARPPAPPPSHRWVILLALLLGFLLLAWGVWWYFEYKIRSLDAAFRPESARRGAMRTNPTPPFIHPLFFTQTK